MDKILFFLPLICMWVTFGITLWAQRRVRAAQNILLEAIMHSKEVMMSEIVDEAMEWYKHPGNLHCISRLANACAAYNLRQLEIQRQLTIINEEKRREQGASEDQERP